MTERPDNDDVGRMIYDLTHTGELSMLYRCRIADALDAFRALDAHTVAQPAVDVSEPHVDEHQRGLSIADERQKPAPDAVAEARINWRDDPDAVVEDDEMDVRGGEDTA